MRLVAALALALTVACTDTEVPHVRRSTIEAYQAALAQLRLRSSMYANSMDAATLGTCVGMHNTYDLDVRPLIVQRMGTIAPSLDDMIAAHDGASYADVECITESIHAALDMHAAAACTFDTPDANAAEAHRYVDALDLLIDAGVARTDEMLAGLASGFWHRAWVFSAPVTACP